MELGLLDINGINEACEISLLKYENIKLELSPKYQENCAKLEAVNNYKIGGHTDGYKKVIINITDSYKTNKINIFIENCEQDEND